MLVGFVNALNQAVIGDSSFHAKQLNKLALRDKTICVRDKKSEGGNVCGRIGKGSPESKTSC